jgi:hypothetical protein
MPMFLFASKKAFSASISVVTGSVESATGPSSAPLLPGDAAFSFLSGFFGAADGELVWPTKQNGNAQTATQQMMAALLTRFDFPAIAIGW